MDYTALCNGCNVTPLLKSRRFGEDFGRSESLIFSKPSGAVLGLKNKTPQYNNGVLFPRRKHFSFQKLLSAGGDAL